MRLLLLMGCVLCFTTAGAADLVAVYRRAVQNDPQLREAEANRLAAIEAKPQAQSALLPQLSASGSAARERDTGSTNTSVPLIGYPGAPPNTQLSYGFNGQTTTISHQYGVTLRQNVFNWSNWVALQRADAQLAQAEADYEAAQQDLIERVSQRYFDVLAAQDELEAQTAALASVNRQLEQAESRYQAGLTAITDVQQARAEHDSGVASVIESKRQVATARELLWEITGDAFDSLARPVEPFQTANPDPANEEQWVQMALRQNLALVSSRLAADIARENVSAAQGGHAPTLDIVASHFKNTSNGDSLFPDGTSAGGTAIDQTARSIGLQITFPIYAGGAVASQVRQAVYLQRAAKERVERIARATERATRDSYLGVLSESSRVKALRQAVDSNSVALESTEAGYEAGTRSAVDVLQSRRLWVQARTNYARSRYDYLINVLKLQQAAGILSEQSLGSINSGLKEPPAP
ncbi:MAG: TolC family outer membrane protein [Steroidobacterales bacterium]